MLDDGVEKRLGPDYLKSVVFACYPYLDDVFSIVSKTAPTVGEFFARTTRRYFNGNFGLHDWLDHRDHARLLMYISPAPAA